MTDQPPDDVRQADLAAQALQLRRAGLGYREIATQMGSSPSTAHGRVRRALRETLREGGSDELRALELERLDRYQREVERILAQRRPLVNQGRTVIDPATGQQVPDEELRLRALDRALRISKRRAELLRLDVPVRIVQELTHRTEEEEQQVNAEILRLIDDIQGASAEEARRACGCQRCATTGDAGGAS